MEHQADHLDVRVTVAQHADGHVKSRGELATLLGGAHALVVFDVIAENEVGAAHVVAHATYLLPIASMRQPLARQMDEVFQVFLPGCSPKSRRMRSFSSNSVLMESRKPTACVSVSETRRM